MTYMPPLLEEPRRRWRRLDRVVRLNVFNWVLGAGVVDGTAAMRAGQDDDDESQASLRAPAFAYATPARGAR